MLHSARRPFFLLSICAALLAVTAPAALAGPLVASAPSCASESLARIFAPWNDPGSYTLAPGGDFEHGAPGWSLGKASVVAGNESYYVGSRSDSSSLALHDGDVVTSAAVCVGIDHPTIRFFARGADPAARIAVDVLFEDALGATRSAPLGSVPVSGGWAPTPIQPVGAALLPLMPGQTTAVAFRFTASGAGVSIDDVYVDPWSWK